MQMKFDRVGSQGEKEQCRARRGTDSGGRGGANKKGEGGGMMFHHQKTGSMRCENNQLYVCLILFDWVLLNGGGKGRRVTGTATGTATATI